MRTFGGILFLMHCLLVSFAALAEPPPAPEGRVMIVLDGSGSMWGQIEGEPKISIARRVVRDLLADWDPKMAVGLTAYGHRRKGDCTDIEVLVPVALDAQAAVLAAIDTLQPKGKTPLSDAVRVAAESLKFSEERASVILVSDGKETCDVDPCALGNQLEAQGVDFTVHVIGFDVQKAEQGGLVCLAENTGGRFATASDAGSLKAALRETVQEVKAQVAAPPPPEPEPAVLGVRLRALLAPGGPEYDGQVNWWIFAASAGPDAKPLFEQHRGGAVQAFPELEPGEYVVRAEFSDARHIQGRFEIELKDAASMAQDLVFNAGRVRLDALVKADGPATDADITWYILHPKQDLSGKWKQLTYFHRHASGGVYLLPAGSWRIHGQLSDWLYVGAVKEITVEPGGEESHSLVFGSGRVRFDNLLAAGQEAFTGDVDYYIWHPKKDLSGKRKQLTSAYRKHSGYVLTLPAGTWWVSAELADWDHVRMGQEITVEPGGEEAHAFNFGVGQLRVDVTVDGGALDGTVNWTLYEAEADLAGKRREVTYVNRKGSGVVVPLAPGDYLLRAEHADRREKTGETRFSLQAGEEKPVAVDLQAR